ncbi:hypothetical protein TNCT_555041 [Trichonephila clavata]|uniref:Uncharacterized protein n=1 Tax=Trichonephila clavata TaxID=2740835 RepID=A0A8X6GTZ5_TRICU|nr:hypothetical protein TNCT_555041 [Trichonephila clavata]
MVARAETGEDRFWARSQEARKGKLFKSFAINSSDVQTSNLTLLQVSILPGHGSKSSGVGSGESPLDILQILTCLFH